jgi:predicted amidohydrolase YtcJ
LRAELILLNVRIYGQPREAQLQDVAVGGGCVLRIGNRLAHDHAPAGTAQTIDCRGATVLPGFVDAHLHFFSFVDSLLSVDLRPDTGIRNIAGIQTAIRKRAELASPGEWIRARNYNEFHLQERRHPTRWDLDAAAPTHPVKLTHRTLHAHVLNSAALKLVGIDAGTPDPPRGMIDRDPTGEPTGLLYEMGELLAERIPRRSSDQFERAVKDAARELSRCGITAWMDASPNGDLSRRELLQDYRARGLIPQNVAMTLGAERLSELGLRRSSPWNSGPVPVWGMKIIVDRTTGLLRPEQAELNELVARAHETGWPVAIHVVEEEALQAALTAFEHAMRAGNSPNPGHRIEHGSVCSPHLARSLAALGITVTTQPAFVHYHGDRYLSTVPLPQQQHLYPLATWLRSGVAVAASSDCPLVSPAPLMGIHAAVTRMTRNRNLLGDNQWISAQAAIRMYTSAAATAAALPGGSLRIGGAADVVVLSEDPLCAPADSLSSLEVLLTINSGNVVWNSGKLQG